MIQASILNQHKERAFPLAPLSGLGKGRTSALWRYSYTLFKDVCAKIFYSVDFLIFAVVR